MEALAVQFADQHFEVAYRGGQAPDIRRGCIQAARRVQAPHGPQQASQLAHADSQVVERFAVGAAGQACIGVVEAHFKTQDLGDNRVNE
ncbi:hypothetical protein D3C72_1880110 [compost metagenome]